MHVGLHIAGFGIFASGFAPRLAPGFISSSASQQSVFIDVA